MNSLVDVLFDTSGEILYFIFGWLFLAIVIFQFLNYFFEDKWEVMIAEKQKSDILIGGLFGFIPGCGGTIFLINLFKEEKIGLGTLVASFITTVGEVSLILIVIDPLLLIYISVISYIAAIIVGYIVKYSKIQQKYNIYATTETKKKKLHTHEKESKKALQIFSLIDHWIIPILFTIIFLIVFPFTIIASFIPDGKENFSNYLLIVEWISIIILPITIIYYLIRIYFIRNIHDEIHSEENIHNKGKEGIKHQIGHISYNLILILTWVSITLLIVDLVIYAIIYYSNIYQNINDLQDDIDEIKNDWWYLIVLVIIGALIGLIPTCGPQIAFTLLMIGELGDNNAIAFGGISALIANSISQDGHAGIVYFTFDKKGYGIVKLIELVAAIIFGLIFIPLDKYTSL
ncbi:MAG: membrane protein [Candidatus Hepatoplasma scabrum]|nr:MAG: membrane protein [Candidatus Hepatoplasma sp.]